MKKFILAAGLALSLLLAPASTEAVPKYKKQYAKDGVFLAVFCDPGLTNFWDLEHVDYFYVADDWTDLDEFVRETKLRAGEQPIVVDIEIHGSPRGCLVLGEDPKDPGSWANEGYLLNRLDLLMPNELVVIQESCFSGIVMRRNFAPEADTPIGTYFEYHPTEIAYPIYGVDNVPNISNTMFAQYCMDEWFYRYDLRKFISEDPGKPDRRSKNEKTEILRIFFYYWELWTHYHEVPAIPIPGDNQEISKPLQYFGIEVNN